MKPVLKTAPTVYPVSLKEIKQHLNITVGWTEDDDYLQTLLYAATKKAEQYLRRRLITQTWYAYYDEWPVGTDAFVLPFGKLQGTPTPVITYTETDGTENVWGIAQGTITMAGIAIANETFVIGSQTFTWKATRSTTGEVGVGTTAAEAVTNIVTAITADITTVLASDGAGDTVVINAASAGTAGNSIVFTEASTNMTIDGSGTLGSTTAGVDEFTVDTNSDPGRIVLDYGYTWPTATLHPTNPIEIEFACGYGTAGSNVEDMIKHAMKIMIGDLYSNRENILVGVTSMNLKIAEDLLMPYRLHGIPT